MQMRKNVKQGIHILSICAILVLLVVSDSEGQVTNLAGPTGLTGSSQVLPGDEVLIYSVGLAANGLGSQINLGQNGGFGGAGLPGIQITISDLSSSTPLAPADFTELRLYRSADATLDVGDQQMGPGVAANVGALTVFDVTALPSGAASVRAIPTGAGIYFLITAVISPTATPGSTFRVGAASPHIGVNDATITTNYQFAAGFPAADGDNIIIGDSNQSSSFLNGQAGGGRGIPFGGEPVMLVLLIGTGLYMIRRQLV